MIKIDKVLLLGSGALKIGEAGEFDYSGTQAIKALKEAGKKIILVNPNIATVQTSKGLADKVYLLPVTSYFVEKVINKEKPQGILLSFGGQTALNCGMDLYRNKILEKYNVQVMGTPVQTIIDTEDRKLFSKRLTNIGLKTAKGRIVKTLGQALKFAASNGFPVMLRAGFALGGSGSGIIRTKEQLIAKIEVALTVYSQIILEESLYGWKEIEYEVMRDKEDNCITVCNMENFDPTGIHTGDSIVIAPSQTLTNNEYYFLRDISIKVAREIGIVGECNIQFALNPKTNDYRIIEVNARLSRSSALASKATGYPIAHVAAHLALGKTLPEITNSVTKKTTAFFEPALDYVVVKIPRWDIDKFTNSDTSIGSEMKSVGEIMSIARTFEEAIQKGARMLNDGYIGVIDNKFDQDSRTDLLLQLKYPDTMRLFTICSSLRKDIPVNTIHKLTGVDKWFLYKLKNIINVYNKIKSSKNMNRDLLLTAKKHGFSDKQIAQLLEKTETQIRSLRKKYHIKPSIKRFRYCLGPFLILVFLTLQVQAINYWEFVHLQKE